MSKRVKENVELLYNSTDTKIVLITEVICFIYYLGYLISNIVGIFNIPSDDMLSTRQKVDTMVLNGAITVVFYLIPLILTGVSINRLSKRLKNKTVTKSILGLIITSNVLQIGWFLWEGFLTIPHLYLYKDSGRLSLIIFQLILMLIVIIAQWCIAVVYDPKNAKKRLLLKQKEAEQNKIDSPQNIEDAKLLHNSNIQLEFDGKSKFDGNTFQYIGWKILGGILTLITLGIALPFAITFVERWKCNHSVINGRRLSFNGNGVQLLGKWILWLFLILITFGIYAFFVSVKMKAWVVKHTDMVGGKDNVESKFDGYIIQYIGWKLLTGLISLVSLGLLRPIAVTLMMKWEAKHITYNGYRLHFNGNGLQLLGKWILWCFLGIITFGIYLLFLPVKLTKWKVSHLELNALRLAVEEPIESNKEDDLEEIDNSVMDSPIDEEVE